MWPIIFGIGVALCAAATASERSSKGKPDVGADGKPVKTRTPEEIEKDAEARGRQKLIDEQKVERANQKKFERAVARAFQAQKARHAVEDDEESAA